ncbi:epimerase [Pseudomonas taiwanensis]|uniref:SDR family oxidoreductase n=1 Tax=Pseudomonas taiwanensis TaxID=470150 RepID=UPI0015BF8FF4|nr:NAD-dependent epimerase/dehydratase family protein [Pseudomonas taiwanensis]NWL76811.1 epimerase [Pseudomonas taiwanensis]
MKTNDPCIGVLGARCSVGSSLIPILATRGKVVAFSRHPRPGHSHDLVEWASTPGPLGDNSQDLHQIDLWISLLPIWILRDILPYLAAMGAKRIVAMSSTSVLAKQDSPDPRERELAVRLAEGEAALLDWAAGNDIEVAILRPTMIYGNGRDANLCAIAKMIRTFGFFPVIGNASGLRQPIHADDLASACAVAITIPQVGKIYTLSGGEVLTYREMLVRLFTNLGKPVRILSLPSLLFELILPLINLIPRYRNWTVGMAQRMNSDQAFPHTDAYNDLDFRPRNFELRPEDLP